MATANTGVAYTNQLARQRVLASQILVNGSGVAAGDVDGDGWVDLYFCGLDSDNRLYRNLGKWRFEDITALAGVGLAGQDTTGAAFADLDGDGDLDLVVNSIGSGTRILFNDGTGRFALAPEILNPERGGSSLALSDVDGDGDLDLYVANYRAATFSDAPFVRFTVQRADGEFVVSMVDGKPVTHPDLTNRFNFRFILEGGGRGRLAHEENGEVDVLYLNDGQGRFEAVSFTGGRFLDEHGQPLSQPPYDWGLAAAFRDLNGDLHPDLYVCNDFQSPDRLWLNDGQGNFRAAPPLTLRQTSLASMAVDFADLNRDGHDELFVADMLSREHERRLTQRNMLRGEQEPVSSIVNRPLVARNTLQLNRGDGTFAEIAQAAGIEASEWTWSPVFLDVDLDGYEDLLIGNGFERDNINLDAIARVDRAKAGARLTQDQFLRLRAMFPRHATPNLAFRNLGNLRFEEVSRRWGFDAPTIAQGICLADLDNDGDLDLVVNNLNDPAVLYRNLSEAPRLAVRLQGLPPNTRGIGSRIRVYGGAVPLQTQEMMSGGRYLSSDDAMRVFAAGTPTNRLRVEIDWRSGLRSVVEDVEPGRVLIVEEASAREVDRERPAAAPAWFEDRTDQLRHRHRDDPHDDRARQPLLPKSLSHLGPGVAWFDFDRDGWDDLVIGAGRGGQIALFRNNRQGGFTQLRVDRPAVPQTHAHTAVLGHYPGPDRAELLVGLTHYPDGHAGSPAVAQFNLGTRRFTETLGTALPASVGPLALADFNGDGQLDLFVGGRVTAARYPEPCASALFVLRSGTWVRDEPNTARLSDTGLVSGAVWTDLTGNGWPDLVLACEWGPIRIFRNRHGVLEPWDPPVRFSPDATRIAGIERLSQLTGWWTSVAAGDFDGDGALDLVAANWGVNSRYEYYGPHPVRVYYADYDQDGVVELIVAGFQSSRQRFVPDRWVDVYAGSMPFLLHRFPTHQAWAETDVEAALGPLLAETRIADAVCRLSLVLLNRQDHFQIVPLPQEAQLSPAFGACVADFDGDGCEDVFLAQNFFGVDRADSRYDAGRGLLLRGDGSGRFESVPGSISGLAIYGEQRGAAVCDYDRDGRVDLVVTQNNAETRLYRNRAARPGLRVRLERSDDRAPVVGATVRLRFGQRWGPARELRAGTGYWSQDSSVLVMAQPETPSEVWVRWPRGSITQGPVPPGSSEITLQWDPAAIPLNQ